jgi:hypothetical protein
MRAEVTKAVRNRVAPIIGVSIRMFGSSTKAATTNNTTYVMRARAWSRPISQVGLLMRVIKSDAIVYDSFLFF